MRKNKIIFLLILITGCALFLPNKFDANAGIVAVAQSVDIYTVYDEKLNILFQREDVEMGDNYLSDDYKYYEITYIDSANKYAIAKFITQKIPPLVKRSYEPKKIKVEDRKICMYMTHNDESYVPTDGVDSVYGNGGIKDVALALKSELEKKLVDVYFDDTLHIPHDTSAYSRSNVTARNLQKKYSPDAIFDIHRDGASRSYYVTKVDGKERARVRMVIGKANPNMALNEEFAMYLMSVGKELYPWLFTDIYYAKGHYNQALDSKAILFEMSSHLVEKDLVIDSMKELSDVITTALYSTTLNEGDGELVIDGVETKEDKIINDVLDEKEEKVHSSSIYLASMMILVSSGICALLYAIFIRFTKTNALSKKKK